MVSEMSSILRELELVQDALGSLARDAHDEKTALLGRQEELRTRAAHLADQISADCPTQQLLVQLAELRRQRDAIARQKSSAASPNRPLLGSPPNGVSGHSRQPQPSSGLPRIDERIHRIQSMLSERGIHLR